MKKISLLILTCVMCYAYAVAQTWSLQNSGTTENLYSIFSPDNCTVFSAGNNGSFLKSTNRGGTWKLLSYNADFDFRSCYFLNTATGVAVGQYAVTGGGFFLKTTDGALNWTGDSSLTTFPKRLIDVFFSSSTAGWVVGDAGFIAKTNNGGTSWAAQTSNTLEDLKSIYMTDSLRGWVVGTGEIILKTTDGGATWAPQTPAGTGQDLNDVTFVNSTNGWAVGKTGVIQNTINGGAAWLTQTSGTGNELMSVDFVNDSTGWTTGVSGTIRQTTDYGTTWSAQTSGTTQRIRSLNMISLTEGFFCGNAGTVGYAGPVTPVANFSTDTTICLGTANNFSDLSSGIPTSWSWNFGDGNTSALQNPSHTYAAVGTYIVTLTVINATGCQDTKTLTVYVAGNIPSANFSGAPTNVCIGDAVVFTDLSTNAPVTWLWSYGDGNTSTSQNPSYTYNAIGTYNVSLTVSNGCGVDLKNVNAYINVLAVPTSDFTNTTVCKGNTTSFTDASIGTIVGWAWDFKDGGTSNVQNPTHLYANSGAYNVDLTVTDANGCTDIFTRTVTVLASPVAAFSNTSGCVNTAYAFTDQSTGTPVLWAWNFGDATTSTVQNPSKTYVTSGSFNVTLVITNIFGCMDSISKALIISPGVPVADFSGSLVAICSGQSVAFSDLSTNSPLSWSWTFGNGSSTLQNPVNNYPTAGSYSISLTAANGCGSNIKSIASYITVLASPFADFSSNTACLGNPTNFTNLSTGSIATLLWAFGDGNTSTAQSPSNVYSTSGNFNASLIVTDSAGCKDTFLTTVAVSPGVPVASFSASDSTICTGSTINFTDLSTNNPTTWLWDFGDGNTSAAQNPANTFIANGSFNASLTATNSCGSNLKFITITVSSSPVAGFAYSGVCQGTATQFTDTSVGAISSWTWDFGDGNVSTSSDPAHTYSIPGIYTVKLIVSLGTCTDSVTKSVTINANLVADFSFVTVCPGSPMSFTDLSTGTITGWLWNFGDGDTSILINPTHTYVLPGTYSVNLLVKDNNNCNNNIVKTIILNGPVADFSGNIACLGNPTTFSDSSTGTIMKWAWNFGDGATDSLQNPSHIYAIDSTYTVILTVTDSNSCSNSYSGTVSVTMLLPVSNFGSDKLSFCLGETVTFSDSCLNTDTRAWTFGDGNSSTLTNPVHTYTTGGSFVVILIASNGCGSDTSTKTITVFSIPLADFTYTATSLTVSFTFNGTGSAWSWSFGDGNSSTQQNPTYTYSTAGSYMVSLNVTDGNGCSKSISKTISVTEVGITDSQIGNDFITVYPNPGNDDRLFVMIPNSIGKKAIVDLSDITGRTLIHYECTVNSNGIAEIDIASLNKGAYLLKAQTDKNYMAKVLVF